MNSLLARRWAETWHGLGAAHAPENTLAELIDAYTGPERHYHNLSHVVDCLDKLDKCGVYTEHRAELEIALWFHDAVYNARATDNEQRSADLARSVLAGQRIVAPSIKRIVDLILVTAHSSEPATEDQRLICDIDLSILGETWERFVAYDRQIALEYAWVEQNVYRRKRGEVLAGFLKRPRIYHMGFFYDLYEVDARRNLRSLLASLSDEMGTAEQVAKDPSIKERDRS